VKLLHLTQIPNFIVADLQDTSRKQLVLQWWLWGYCWHWHQPYCWSC